MAQERPPRLTWMMGLASVISMRSEDPYVQVGSLAVRDDWSVAGIGYNGLPAGVDMPAEFWRDRDGRRPYMIHAEINALRYCRAGEVKRVISTHIPCASCMSVLGSYHVDEVYFGAPLGEAHDMDTILNVATLNRIWLQHVQQETYDDTQGPGPTTVRDDGTAASARRGAENGDGRGDQPNDGAPPRDVLRWG